MSGVEPRSGAKGEKKDLAMTKSWQCKIQLRLGLNPDLFPARVLNPDLGSGANPDFAKSGLRTRAGSLTRTLQV